MATQVDTRIIQIVTRFVRGGEENLKRVRQSVENLGGNMQKVTTITDKWDKKNKKWNETMKQQNVVAKRFQAQWLSILFLGFAIQRTFTGLIRTSLDWVGINELLSETLGLVFLPVALQLLDVLLPIMEWFINLPDSAKIAIGWFVVAGIVLGGLAVVAGQLALGLAGLSWLATAAGIGEVGTAAAGATGTLSAMMAVLGKAALITIGITIAFAGFTFLKSGIKEGSILKELGGIVGMGLGLGAIGLAVGGPWGAGIGFAIGISGAIIIDWIMGGKVGSNLNRLFSGIGSSILPSLLPKSVAGIGFSGGLLGFADGGVVPGRLGNPVPILAHAGETVIPIGGGSSGGGSVNVSAVYNVTVSDRREFETLLRENNIKLTEDVRRLVKA